MDLTKILEGKEGTKLYSPLFGQVTLINVTPKNGWEQRFPIKISAYCSGQSRNVWFTKEGYYFEEYQDCECLLFPSKEIRDWNRFKSDLPIGTPVFVRQYPDTEWALRYYAGNHRTYNMQELNNADTTEWKFIVPVNLFNIRNKTFNAEDNYGTANI